MCVTEQYVISGFTRCQGQGDIWRLLPEHVFARVSKSVCNFRKGEVTHAN